MYRLSPLLLLIFLSSQMVLKGDKQKGRAVRTCTALAGEEYIAKVSTISCWALIDLS